MMTQHPTTRPGISLIEAMIAIGVMAIGLLSLLTLFPLGALQIGKALKDDRCSETALQADAYLRAYWKRTVVDGSTFDSSPESFFWAFDDPNLESHTTAGSTSDPNVFLNTYHSTNLPNPGFAVTTTNGNPITAYDVGSHLYEATAPADITAPTPPTHLVRHGTRLVTPSYPVLIDPIGWYTWSGGSKRWVSYENPSTPKTQLLLPRRNLAGITLSEEAVRICILPDDMTFDPIGLPSSPVTRQGKYSWAAIVQRPDNSKPDIANLTILVFDGRPPLLPLADSERIATVSGGLVAGQTNLTITVPAATDPNAPAIVRRGGWIMDGTISQAGPRNAKFYRIAAVDSTTPNVYTIDLETPIEDTISTPQIYLFEGLAEVFRRPPLQ